MMNPGIFGTFPRRTVRSVLFLVLLAEVMALVVTAPTPAGCAAPDRPATKWAVIVGINHYSHLDGYHQLNYAVSDARRLFGTLTDPGVADVPPDHVVLLTTDQRSPALQPTRQTILSTVSGLAAKAGPRDQFWFYFAGHGDDYSGVSYLIPSDFHIVPGDQYNKTAISTRELREILTNGCRARQKIIILDACHSGSSRALTPKSAPTSVFDAPGMITLTSCDVNQECYEEPHIGGVFTYFLDLGLRGKGEKDQDHIVTATELVDYVGPSVLDFVKANQLGKEQTPRSIVKLEGDVALSTPGAAAAPTDTSPTLPAGTIEVKAPLGPALVVVLDEKRTLLNGGTVASEIAETVVRQGLLNDHFLLMDPSAAHQLAAILDKTDQVAAAAGQGARYLLRGTVETAATKLAITGDFVNVQATIAAELVDEQGKVLAEFVIGGTDSEPISGIDITEPPAAKQAIEKAANILVQRASVKLATVLKAAAAPPPD